MNGPRSFGAACFLLLAVFAAARLALPFFPSEFWSESGFHCASYYVYLPLGKPHSCQADRAFGEGARVANRLDFVSLRREKFTVDGRGYRNPPLSEMKPRVIFQGSSFGFGFSLSDDDTFSARINRRLGPVVYNASKVLNPTLSPAPSIETARQIGMGTGAGRWVLLELLNRGDYRYEPDAPATGHLDAIMDRAAGLKSFQRRIKDPFALSRLGAMINMRLQNDVVFPNPDRWRFPEEVLKNGRHMLFYVDDRRFFLNPPPPERTSASVRRLRDDLAAAGLNLAVVLVPSGYSVYWHLLRGVTPEAAAADPGVQYFGALSDQLRAASIPVLNTLPLLRDAATRELTAGRLVYWPDDAHWNPAGAAAAAEAAAAWLGELLNRT